MDRQYNLAVCRFPGDFSEHPHSSNWVIKHYPVWLRDSRIGQLIPLWASDTPITMVRNATVKTALDRNADYILMIDSDMFPDCEPDGRPFWEVAWEFLMDRREREEAHRRHVSAADDGDDLERKFFELYPPATIAAPYCGSPPYEAVCVMKWASHGTDDPDEPMPFELTTFDREHAAQFTGIFEVGALATGLILYDARVFQHLPPPWFDYEYDDIYHAKKATTEDVFQTRNARLLGMPQFCAWDCWAGHHKDKLVHKPRSLRVNQVPDTIADAIRKHHVGQGMESKVVVIQQSTNGQEKSADPALDVARSF